MYLVISIISNSSDRKSIISLYSLYFILKCSIPFETQQGEGEKALS